MKESRAVIRTGDYGFCECDFGFRGDVLVLAAWTVLLNDI